jgi:hypothetical protein
LRYSMGEISDADNDGSLPSGCVKPPRVDNS